MILAEDGQHWLVVTQNDHAALAADLLTSWRSLGRLSGRELLLRATRRHDNGWQEADSAPRVDAEGSPLDFLGTPSRDRRQLWERGMDRYRRSDPACALLIVEHAIALHRERRSDSEIEALMSGAEERRRELLAEVPQGSELLATLYPWLRVADDLSLKACLGRPVTSTVDLDAPPAVIRATVARSGGDPGPATTTRVPWRLALAPFPFAGATSHPLRCRRIPRRPYRDDADLATTLALARWLDLSLRTEPLEP
jgi:hypothetical protein